MLFASDARPHGLLEGIDAHFPHASVLGATATLTPFETGREHTLFYDTPEAPRKVYEEGAVGVALTHLRPREAVLEVTLEHLAPIGKRLEVSGARGNVISSLDHFNAAQQFLRLLTEKRAATGSTQAMEVGEVRALSSVVSKDDAFYLGIFEGAHAQEPDEKPVLLAQVVSGHPMRGTISLDTQAELGIPADAPPGTAVKRWAQFFRPAPRLPAAVPDASGAVRYVFVSHPGEGDAPMAADPAAATAQPHAQGALGLRDVFLAASEQGWAAREGAKVRTPTYACNVPYTRAALHFQ